MPSISEKEEVKAIKNHVEGKPSWGEEFPAKPAFTHYNSLDR